MLIAKMILVRFFAIVDSQTSFTLCSGVGVGNFGKVGIGKFWKQDSELGILPLLRNLVCSPSSLVHGVKCMDARESFTGAVLTYHQ